MMEEPLLKDLCLIWLVGATPSSFLDFTLANIINPSATQTHLDTAAHVARYEHAPCLVPKDISSGLNAPAFGILPAMFVEAS